MAVVSERIAIEYKVRFTSPFHLGTGSGAGLIDRMVRRDARGYLVIPGSAIKGAVREKCWQLACLYGLRAPSPHVTPDDDKAWNDALLEFRPRGSLLWAIFGSRVRPGSLYFDDATMDTEYRALFDHRVPRLQRKYREHQVEVRTQLGLSRQTGTARPHLLYTSEYGLREIPFSGRISGVITDLLAPSGQVTYALILLLAGLLAVDHLGGNVSPGIGHCRLELTYLLVNGQACSWKDLVDLLPDLEYYDLDGEEERQ